MITKYRYNPYELVNATSILLVENYDGISLETLDSKEFDVKAEVPRGEDGTYSISRTNYKFNLIIYVNTLGKVGYTILDNLINLELFNKLTLSLRLTSISETFEVEFKMDLTEHIKNISTAHKNILSRYRSSSDYTQEVKGSVITNNLVQGILDNSKAVNLGDGILYDGDYFMNPDISTNLTLPNYKVMDSDGTLFLCQWNNNSYSITNLITLNSWSGNSPEGTIKLVTPRYLITTKIFKIAQGVLPIEMKGISDLLIINYDPYLSDNYSFIVKTSNINNSLIVDKYIKERISHKNLNFRVDSLVRVEGGFFFYELNSSESHKYVIANHLNHYLTNDISVIQVLNNKILINTSGTKSFIKYTKDEVTVIPFTTMLRKFKRTQVKYVANDKILAFKNLIFLIKNNKLQLL